MEDGNLLLPAAQWLAWELATLWCCGVQRRFDNVYMDDSIRVSKDIRGDILITARDGAAQRFQRLQQT